MTEPSKTRFVTYEREDESQNRTVDDIVEFTDVGDRKKNRRRLMKQLGQMVNRMLDDEITSFDVYRLG